MPIPDNSKDTLSKKIMSALDISMLLSSRMAFSTMIVSFLLDSIFMIPIRFRRLIPYLYPYPPFIYLLLQQPFFGGGAGGGLGFFIYGGFILGSLAIIIYSLTLQSTHLSLQPLDPLSVARQVNLYENLPELEEPRLLYFYAPVNEYYTFLSFLES